MRWLNSELLIQCTTPVLIKYLSSFPTTLAGHGICVDDVSDVVVAYMSTTGGNVAFTVRQKILLLIAFLSYFKDRPCMLCHVKAQTSVRQRSYEEVRPALDVRRNQLCLNLFL